jgi:hypothetical protein
VGHVAGIGERNNACRVLVGKLSVWNNLEDRGVDGKVILQWMGR